MPVISRYTQVYAPRFSLEIDGENAADIARDVKQFSYSDDEDKSDELTLILVNKGLKYIDDPRFEEGITMRARWGYPGDVSEVMQCVLSKAKPGFPQNGIPTMIVKGFDLSREMHRGGNPQNWGSVQSSDVARGIADRYSLNTDIEDSDDERSDSRIQAAGITDIQYLKQLADQINWDVYVEGSTLHFHPKRYDARPKFEFTYYSSKVGTLLDFNPNVKMTKQARTGKAGADTKSGESSGSENKEGDSDGSPNASLGDFLIDTNSGEFSGRTKGSGSNSNQSRPNPAAGEPWSLIGNTAYFKMKAIEQQVLSLNSPEKSEKVRNKHSAAAQAKIDMNAVEASATMIGTPQLRAKQNITLKGVGKRYSGIWRVKKSTHTIMPESNIYTVACTLTRNALSKGKKGNSGENKSNNKSASQNGSESSARQVNVDTNTGSFSGFS